MTFDKYGLNGGAPGTVSFPVWKCPKCKTSNMMSVSACGCGEFHRPCDICLQWPAHLYPGGMRCDAHIDTLTGGITNDSH